MNTIRTSMVAGIVALLQNSASTASHATLQSPESHAFKTRVLTDVQTVVPSNKIKIDQAGQVRTVLTDAQGYAPWVSILPETPFLLTLKQKATPEGVALGQVIAHEFNALGVQHEVFDFLTLHQPMLQPIVIDAAVQHYTGLGTRWAFQPLPEATYAFPASIGVLLRPQEISAFSAYYGITLPEGDYKMALVIQVADSEPLGVGMGLEMDFSTYGFNDLPVCDRFHVAQGASDLTPLASFQVDPAVWDQGDAPDQGYYYVTGTLMRGMNLVLFGGSASGSYASQVSSPPFFGPVSPSGLLDSSSGAGSSGGTSPLLSAGVDCNPQPSASAPGQTCTPASFCTDHASCAPTGCPSTFSPADCVSWKIAVGQKFCGKADSTGQPSGKTISWTVYESGGINWEIKLGDDFVGGSVGAEGGGGQSFSETQPLSVGNGSGGCGECAQSFQEFTACFRYCIVHKRSFSFLLLSFYCYDKKCFMACKKPTGSSVEHCNRGGC